MDYVDLKREDMMAVSEFASRLVKVKRIEMLAARVWLSMHILYI